MARIANATIFDFVRDGAPPFLVVRVRVTEHEKFKSTGFHTQYTPTSYLELLDAIRVRYKVDRVYLQTTYDVPLPGRETDSDIWY